jgi:hypothetical protein
MQLSDGRLGLNGAPGPVVCVYAEIRMLACINGSAHGRSPAAAALG